MKSDKFRRSQNVEDYRDPAKPLNPAEADLAEFYNSIAERLKITNSTLAADLGGGDILTKKDS